jgi:uncharacterized protein YwgA
MEIQNPKYYRQKFILSFLELMGGRLTKMDFQKLLFLSQKETEYRYYDFVPYQYGCYSFLAQSDIELLESRGWLEIKGNDICLSKNIKNNDLSAEFDKNGCFIKKYEKYRGKKLVRYVYEKYPYYAINSKMAPDVMDENAYNEIYRIKNKMKSNIKELFTIGYEGLSIEKYINNLVYNDIHLLCDVRSNPLSRKFGFSKSSLSKLLPKFDIKYIHIPELGIASENRINLETKSDYEELFKEYKKTIINKIDALANLEDLFDKYNRIALTCFEKDPELCHRHCISEYIESLSGIKAVNL